MEIVYLADLNRPAFEHDRLTVDVMCVGDSITGWNNLGPANYWPFPTYPRFLQELCEPLKLRMADGGIAGEVSDKGLDHVQRYLDLFPNSRYFIIGFGTNDLGTWSDPEPTSRQIIENLDKMVHAVRDEEKLPLLFNVPYANEPMFSSYIAKDTHEKRDYHNGRLAEYCQQNEVPLADICAYLQDEHLGDELHPNREGAKIIAVEVFKILESLVRGGA